MAGHGTMRGSSTRTRSGRARTHHASGRLLCLLVLATGCQTVGGPGPRGVDSPGSTVVVQPGPISAQEQNEAARLWESARRSADARRFFEVLRTTDEILTRFPASDVSGEALRLTAHAELEVDSLARAAATAERYLSLLGSRDLRAPEMRIVQARAAEDDEARRLDRLLRMTDAASPAQRDTAAALAREAADALSAQELRAVVDSVDTRGPVAPVAEARLAVALLEADSVQLSGTYARRAIESGASGEDLEWARGVLAGELPEGRARTRTFQIAAVMPTTGPPALAEYAAQVMEGVEIALMTVLGPEFTVGVVTADDEGDPELSAQRVRELEDRGVVGVIGFLEDQSLLYAAEARSNQMPLVSPTARSAPLAGDAVYSLEGADVPAARSIARYAASRAYQRVALLYPETPVADVEAEAFATMAESLGMTVAGRFTYAPGETFFEPQIMGARDALRSDELQNLALTEADTLQVEVLEPVALFMPVPPEDVELLAPQVIHFGLDTLGIEILGTSGWTEPGTLNAVDPRLMDGVVATAPVQAGSEGEEAFRMAYESHFQRSLVGTGPAVGYDAALLLLEALRPGRVLPEQVHSSFNGLTEIPGATGVFSVIDGRVVRRTQVVRIQNRTFVPVDVR